MKINFQITHLCLSARKDMPNFPPGNRRQMPSIKNMIKFENKFSNNAFVSFGKERYAEFSAGKPKTNVLY